MAEPHARGFSRRALLQRACAAPVLALGVQAARRAPSVKAARPNDMRILEVDHQFEDFRYRAPYQFGGRSVDRVTLLNVTCRVRTAGGREAWGFGSMTLGNAWAFPAASQDVGLGAMRALAERLRTVTAACDDTGHPIDLFRVLEPEYLRAAASLSRALVQFQSQWKLRRHDQRGALPSNWRNEFWRRHQHLSARQTTDSARPKFRRRQCARVACGLDRQREWRFALEYIDRFP